MKITSVEVIKQGISAKNGKPWTLAKVGFEGKQGTFSGFATNLQPGQDVNVEFYQEEYNGNMQEKFRILSQKALEASQSNETLMRLEKYVSNINTKVNAIYKHLGIEEKQYAGNTTVEYPEYQGAPTFENVDINPEDIPF